MVLKIAFQMDKIESVNINEDTTFRLAEEAGKRGHKLFYYNPKDLSFSLAIFIMSLLYIIQYL